MKKILSYVFVLLFVMPSLCKAESIDVLIKGMDDGVKTNKQQDYKEAVTDAKLQAIERAGVTEAILLPGFQVLDMGYQTDGSYQIVLSGKIQTGKRKSGRRSSDARYIDDEDGTVTDTKTGLMWTKKDSYADLGKCLDWNKSRSYVSSLTTGGYNDWRMPTVEELKSIYEKSKNNKTYSGDTIHSDPIFASGGGHYYWSSETKGSSRAREVFFHYGSAGDSNRDDCSNGGVRAVRR